MTDTLETRAGSTFRDICALPGFRPVPAMYAAKPTQPTKDPHA